MIHFDLDQKQKTITDLEKLTLEDSFWKDKNYSRQTFATINKLKKIIGDFNSLQVKVQRLYDDVINIEKNSEFELMEIIVDDYNNILSEFENFEIDILLTGPYDNNNAIIEFHPGAGGTESQDWTSMLYDMYYRWATKKGYKVEIIDHQIGDEAGLKSASLLISGNNAYGHLKGESGVHRLVRISPFDSNKRRHTSFAAVEVTPKLDNEIDITINETDLKIDTYRASGAGGQHINKTDSAVRITHIPTNIVVSCQSQRSQMQNKEYCFMVLKSKLYTLMLKEKTDEIAKIKGTLKANEWGSQIRSYILQPYTLVKDHRTNYENGNAFQVLQEGNLDGFIFAYLKENMGVDNDD